MKQEEDKFTGLPENAFRELKPGEVYNPLMGPSKNYPEGVFLILIVMGIIASVLQGIVSIPWYVIYIVKMIFTMSDGGATSSSVGLNFAQYLFSILMLYGSYLSAIFGIVGLVYQYGHASEVVDSITVESDIDNFDKL